MNLWPYQVRVRDWLKTKKRAVIVSPAGSGKTIMAAAALEAVLLSRPRNGIVRIGWMAATIEQCQQGAVALAAFPNMTPLIEIKIACAAAQTDWSAFDVLIVDESGHAPAATWDAQIRTCQGARWGFTATPWSDDAERNQRLRDLFDNNFLTITREEVASKIVPAHVYFLSASDPGLQDPIDTEIATLFARRIRFWRGAEWECKASCSWEVCMRRGIVNNYARNNVAVAMATRHAADSTIVLVAQIAHGETLAARIPGSVLCYSGMGKKARRETLEKFKAGDLRCIVATSLADEGLDVPCANVLVLVCGGRNPGKVEQRTGRVLRSDGEKTHGTIYDFTDADIHPLLARHAKQRRNTYLKLGYEIKTAAATALVLCYVRPPTIT